MTAILDFALVTSPPQTAFYAFGMSFQSITRVNYWKIKLCYGQFLVIPHIDWTTSVVRNTAVYHVGTCRCASPAPGPVLTFHSNNTWPSSLLCYWSMHVILLIALTWMTAALRGAWLRLIWLETRTTMSGKTWTRKRRMKILNRPSSRHIILKSTATRSV